MNVVGTGTAVVVVAATSGARLVDTAFTYTKLTLGKPAPIGFTDDDPVGYGALTGTTTAVE